MTEKQQARIKCPFFLNSRKNVLQCESFIGSAAMLTRFPDVPSMLAHVRTYCEREDGGKCPLALNLYDKYARLEQLEREREKRRRYMYLNEKTASPSGAPDARGGSDGEKTELNGSGTAPARTPSRSREWRF